MNRRPLLGILAGVILVLSLLTCGSKPMHGFESGPGTPSFTVTQQRAPAPSPTPTVTPAPTVPPDTKPGKTLEPGQVWRQGGIHMRLQNPSFDPGCDGTLGFEATIVNQTGTNLVADLTTQNLEVSDSRGRSYRTIWVAKGASSHRCYAKKLGDLSLPAIEAGQGITLAVRVIGSYTPEPSYFLVTVRDIGEIQEAKWRIEEPPPLLLRPISFDVFPEAFERRLEEADEKIENLGDVVTALLPKVSNFLLVQKTWAIVGMGVIVAAVLILRRPLIVLHNTLLLAGVGFIAGPIWCVITGRFGAWLAIKGTDWLVSPNVGVVFGAIEGFLIGLVSGFVGLAVIVAALSIVGLLLTAVGSGTGVAVFDPSGVMLGWLGAAPGGTAAFGCGGVIAVGVLVVSPIVGTILGVQMNQGYVTDPEQVYSVTETVMVIVGMIGGLLGGGLVGFKLGPEFGGCLFGLLYGILLGVSLTGRWVEILIGGGLGAVAGFFLGARWNRDKDYGDEGSSKRRKKRGKKRDASYYDWD